jgi:hypothetical protein
MVEKIASIGNALKPERMYILVRPQKNIEEINSQLKRIDSINPAEIITGPQFKKKYHWSLLQY